MVPDASESLTVLISQNDITIFQVFQHLWYLNVFLGFCAKSRGRSKDRTVTMAVIFSDSSKVLKNKRTILSLEILLQKKKDKNSYTSINCNINLQRELFARALPYPHHIKQNRPLVSNLHYLNWLHILLRYIFLMFFCAFINSCQLNLNPFHP